MISVMLDKYVQTDMFLRNKQDHIAGVIVKSHCLFVPIFMIHFSCE